MLDVGADHALPTASTWPIGAALLQFQPLSPGGRDANTAGPEEWLRVLRQVVDAGFDYVDLSDSWLRPADLSDHDRGIMAKLLEQVGLGVTSISVQRKSVIDPDEDVAHDNLQYALRTVEIAPELGTDVVCVGLHRQLTVAQRDALWFWTVPGAMDPIGDGRVWELAVERFREIGERAAAYGVQLSLEMYEDTYLGTAASALALLDDIGLTNVGLNPDLGNLVRLHRAIEDWETVLTITMPRTNYWQVKNYYRDYDPGTGAYFSVPAPLESGYINYRRALDIALLSGFKGPICAEHYGGDGLSVSARNRDYLRALLATLLASNRP